MIKALHETFNFGLSLLFKVSKVAKSVYYYWLKRFKQLNKDEELIKTIKAICEECGYIYGYRRVTQSLLNKGFKVNHKKVRKLMKELNQN
ncbi:IS3 family transposase [Staphylococcus xylosus]